MFIIGKNIICYMYTVKKEIIFYPVMSTSFNVPHIFPCCVSRCLWACAVGLFEKFRYILVGFPFISFRVICFQKCGFLLRCEKRGRHKIILLLQYVRKYVVFITKSFQATESFLNKLLTIINWLSLRWVDSFAGKQRANEIIGEI